MEGTIMNKRIIVVLVGLLVLLTIGIGSSQASGDHNHNTHGEDGNYEENNNNPYGDDDFPGDDNQQRSGVVWP